MFCNFNDRRRKKSFFINQFCICICKKVNIFPVHMTWIDIKVAPWISPTPCNWSSSKEKSTFSQLWWYWRRDKKCQENYSPAVCCCCILSPKYCCCGHDSSILQSRSCLGRVQPSPFIDPWSNRSDGFLLLVFLIHFQLWVLSIPRMGAHWCIRVFEGKQLYTCQPSSSHMAEDFLLLWNICGNWRLLDMRAMIARATNAQMQGTTVSTTALHSHSLVLRSNSISKS